MPSYPVARPRATGACHGVVIDDIKKGYVPNIFAEKGLKAEWKHNPRGLALKVLTTALVTLALVKLLSSRKK